MPDDTPDFLETTFNPEGLILDNQVAFVPAGEYELELLGVPFGPYQKDGYWIPAVRPQWLVCDPELQEAMGIPNPQVQQFIELEYDGGPFESREAIKERGRLVLARNRQTRLAAGLLTPLGFNTGKAWSFAQMIHSRVWGRVELPRDERARYSNVAYIAAKRTDLQRRGRF